MDRVLTSRDAREIVALCSSEPLEAMRLAGYTLSQTLAVIAKWEGHGQLDVSDDGALKFVSEELVSSAHRRLSVDHEWPLPLLHEELLDDPPTDDISSVLPPRVMGRLLVLWTERFGSASRRAREDVLPSHDSVELDKQALQYHVRESRFDDFQSLDFGLKASISRGVVPLKVPLRKRAEAEIRKLRELFGGLYFFHELDPLVNEQMRLGQLPLLSVEHLAVRLGTASRFLWRVAFSPHHFYRRFSVPKKGGGRRQIAEPLPTLKLIQRRLLDDLLYCVRPHVSATAYVRKVGPRSNAKFHTRKPTVVRLDFKNFFGSIETSSVERVLTAMGLNLVETRVSWLIARLVTLDGALPQGAPTSPHLSNLWLRSFDESVLKWARSMGWTYTRYADDMTFAGDGSVSELKGFVQHEASRYSLELNPQKTRVFRQSQRQRVTGAVVNSKVQAPREVRRRIRQEIYYIKKFTLSGHLSKLGETRPHYLQELAGRIHYCLQLDPKNEELRDAAKLLRGLGFQSF